MGIFVKTSNKHSWQPDTTGITATSSYWLNWRVLLCALWVLISMAFASYIISIYEGHRKSKHENNNGVQNSSEKSRRNDKQNGILYADEVWNTCIKGVHPAWLLAFRVCAFFVLLTLLIVNAVLDGASIFYYYTQWTFTLVTIYFGLGSVLSVYGCYDYHKKISGERVANEEIDAEKGEHLDNSMSIDDPISNNVVKKSSFSLHQPNEDCPIAGFWGYALQITFQMNAGAVMLTDCVFWFIMVPFLETKNYDINFFMINMHTVNLLFLLVDTFLNCLRFPWFRISYFILWTSIYVIFQWAVHASISIWWPYPFLDLSSSFAPLWYLCVGIMHIPCYALFYLIIKLKHALLSKYFPQSYQCSK